MALPIKITPCPILEAIIELRFSSKIPAEASEAIFGLIYSQISNEYPTVEKLPILQLPEIVRSMDESLKFQAHWRLKGEKFLINLSPRVFGLINKVYGGGSYHGWEAFSGEINRILILLKKLDVIDKIERFGIRYVNFLEGNDIFEKVTLNLETNFNESKPVLFKFTYVEDGITTNVQISSDATFKDGTVENKGSLIDIDTFVDFPTIETLEVQMSKAHGIAKEAFFKILKPNFLSDNFEQTF